MQQTHATDSVMDEAIATTIDDTTPASQANGTRKSNGKSWPGVEADDIMAEAGRKTLRFHLKRMLKQEAGARAGEDIEAVHDMRVATRRMRAALAIFGPYYKPKLVKTLEAGLRRTAHALGRVRDLDVFLDRAVAYRKAQPESSAEALEPMFARWHVKREKARAALHDWLDDRRYARFGEDFKAFVESEGTGVAADDEEAVHPVYVRHIAPALIWEAYARVRAYDRVVDGAPIETLHALRIEGKRLRYTLEFFAEDLGPTAPELIKQVTAMQDHLGNLHDADVDALALEKFLAAEREADTAGVEAYLKARQKERDNLLGSFGPVWETIQGPDFRRRLGEAVAVL